MGSVASFISTNITEKRNGVRERRLVVFGTEIVGLLGLIILVSVFLLHSAGRLRANSEIYFYGFNAIGALLLTTYAISLPNVYFAVLESVWCIGAAATGAVMFRRVFWNHHGA